MAEFDEIRLQSKGDLVAHQLLSLSFSLYYIDFFLLTEVLTHFDLGSSYEFHNNHGIDYCMLQSLGGSYFHLQICRTLTFETLNIAGDNEL